MKLVHIRPIIKDVRDRWTKQYAHYSDETCLGIKRRLTCGEIRANLAALDLEACSAGDVDAAIGVSGWADNRCDECGTNCDVLVRLGEEPDYEARWQDLCGECLTKAADALSRATNHTERP